MSQSNFSQHIDFAFYVTRSIEAYAAPTPPQAYTQGKMFLLIMRYESKLRLFRLFSTRCNFSLRENSQAKRKTVFIKDLRSARA